VDDFNPERQTAQPRHRQRLQHRLSTLRRHRRNMAGHRGASWVKLQVRVRVVLRIFRRSVVAEAPHVSDLALRHRRARVHMSVASRNNDHNLRFASQSRRHLPARLRVKQAAREKEGKVLMVNLAGHHQEVEHLLQQNTVRGSHNTERSNQRKERRRPGHNNSSAIIVAAPERKISGAAFFVKALTAVAAAVSGCNSIKFAGGTPASTAIRRSGPRSTQRL